MASLAFQAFQAFQASYQVAFQASYQVAFLACLDEETQEVELEDNQEVADLVGHQTALEIVVA
jgi:cell fate (sporulation/competence/biofilm development) regulator YlbF (YheA/YmcA/DUF963 family)